MVETLRGVLESLVRGLIDAWFVHSMAALGLQVICLRLIRWCSPRVGSRWGS